MKTIGLIGGMSWESTIPYYRIINQKVRERLGELHSAQCVLWSFEFQKVVELQHKGDWEELTRMMIDAAHSLERAGADFTVICTNTMHKMAQQVDAATKIPLLHIADVTATAIKAKGIRKVGLLATRFTMEQEFYKGRLRDQHGLEVLIPDDAGRQTVHDIIYNELCAGVIKPESRDRFRAVIEKMTASGAEGIILGCTEIGLLVQPEDSAVPLFDTTSIHAEAAVDFSLK